MFVRLTLSKVNYLSCLSRLALKADILSGYKGLHPLRTWEAVCSRTVCIPKYLESNGFTFVFVFCLSGLKTVPLHSLAGCSS
jgi:hypothetical protein